MHDGIRSPLTDASSLADGSSVTDASRLSRHSPTTTSFAAWPRSSASPAVEQDLVAHIAEVDGRKLYAREASRRCSRTAPGLFTSRRARPTCESPWPGLREHPILLEMLGDGVCT